MDWFVFLDFWSSYLLSLWFKFRESFDFVCKASKLGLMSRSDIVSVYSLHFAMMRGLSPCNSWLKNGQCPILFAVFWGWGEGHWVVSGTVTKVDKLQFQGHERNLGCHGNSFLLPLLLSHYDIRVMSAVWKNFKNLMKICPTFCCVVTKC